MRVLVAVPALNEAAVIGQVLASLSAVHPLSDVVLVDDGSRDATASIARAAGARVVSHAINLGVGAAMGTAFKFALQNGYDAVIQFDGDGQHRPENIADLYRRARMARSAPASGTPCSNRSTYSVDVSLS